jgi:LysR family cyn operon transcriptional activator
MGEQGLRAIPIIGMDTEENRMYGCIHILRNVYQKKSAQEFIRMLGESTSVLRQALL